MRKAWTLTCLLLLTGYGVADESKKVRFHIDPPNFTVGYKGTVTGGITSNAPTAQAQELALPPISGGYYVSSIVDALQRLAELPPPRDPDSVLPHPV